MTVKQLIEHLKLYDENKEIKMTYDGSETFCYIDIKSVEENVDFVYVDSSEFEPQG